MFVADFISGKAFPGFGLYANVALFQHLFCVRPSTLTQNPFKKLFLDEDNKPLIT